MGLGLTALRRVLPSAGIAVTGAEMVLSELGLRSLRVGLCPAAAGIPWKFSEADWIVGVPNPNQTQTQHPPTQPTNPGD